MTRPSLLAMLLAAGAAASDLLYVSSMDGNITTLNMGMTTPAAGGKYPSFKSVARNQDCAPTPSWLTLNHAAGQLFCIDEAGETASSLSSYKTSADGTLTKLGRVETPKGPVSGIFYGCKGHGFAMAHYGGSAISTWDVSDPANIKNVQTLKFTQPLGPKQEAPRPHQVILDPTGKYIVTPDLGSDVIRLYSFDPKSLKVTEIPPVTVKPGSGPRHVAFAVRGPKTFMYVVTELGNTIIGFEVTYGDTIQLKEIFNIDVHGEGKGVIATAAASEVIVSPDQKFLIASSRREYTVKIPDFDDKNKQIDSDPLINFSIDESSGKLTFKQSVSSGGRFPRQFSMNKAGTKVAVGMQFDARVVIIKRDPQSGDLGDFESFSNVSGNITSVFFDE
ncbi:3-carboxymuconate cyclase [Cordyceps militaris]|uniref:3-carboxymuconate cyclase n=1 Tax=Cordyceps militaris TaxID=73501 RepID=A0A2H4SMB0_CORMI|nr:3-carboxymuconate cyclase [Cordyceps militaris]